jgi:hypothetical protein
VLLTGYLKYFKLYYLPFLILLTAYALYKNRITKKFPFLQNRFFLLFPISLLPAICYQWMFDDGITKLIIFFIFTLTFLLAIKWIRSYFNIQNPLILAAAFIILFDTGVLFDKGGPEIYFHGKIQGKIDPWADIQQFAKNHSDKDDLFIVPPYMNDFTNYSLRATLGDWAEGSTVIYLDNQFAEEWFARMNDLGWRKWYLPKEGYNKLTTDEIISVAKKYKAKFVVTEKPKIFNLQKLYENERYILYKTF